MKPYSKYKSSGVEWLGDVPEHWVATKLKWHSTRYTGGTPDRSNQLFWDGGTIPWINSGAVNQRFITEPSAFITNEGYVNSSTKYVNRFDLVMALAGQGRTKGMVAQMGIDATCNQSMAAISPKSDFVVRYLFWLLESQYVHIRNMAGGEQRDGLNLELLGSIPCLRPPLDEQKAISNFLDRETSRIDDLIEKKRTLVERLKEKRRALISRTVTKGLPADLPLEMVSKLEEIAGAKPILGPPLKPSGIEWIGDVPEHWEIAKFSREVAIKQGQVDPETDPYSSMVLVGPEHVESGTGTLRIQETAEQQAAESGKYLVQKGEVIYSKIRPALRKVVIAPIDCLCSADMYPLKGRYRIHNPYLGWLLLSDRFTSWSIIESDRVAMPKINRETLNELRLPIPPLYEQRAISALLDLESAKIDALMQGVFLAIERLLEYRSSLITAAVTGKIDVRSVASQ